MLSARTLNKTCCVSADTQSYMTRPDIIVIGASAGGIEALKILAAGLPPDLPASVFVVVHMGAGLNGHSMLADILCHAGPLPAVSAKDGEEIRQGRIYVAIPDFHLLIEPGRVRVVYGPKENLTRPAINPLFRSAAAAYGPRVVGVVLTGLLDDGVAGLAEIKRQDGVAVVQDPATAVYPSMPSTALEYVEADYVVDLEHLAGVLAKIVSTTRDAKEVKEPMTRILTDITCPECRGPIWEERQGTIMEFRCRVGHAYSSKALALEHRSTVERTIWAAIVALEEAAEIDERLASEVGEEALEDAKAKREQVAALKSYLAQTRRS